MRTAAASLTAVAMLFCLSPAALAQPAPPDTHIAVLAAGQRESYIVKSEAELEEWQVRLLRFCDEAKAQARADTAATRNELLTALEKAEAGASRLQSAGAESWDDARTSYEKATSELEVAWGKVQADRR
nr:hypothetical protein [uncultured Rhodopila sp.]